ncbi:TPA: hypothetical protein OUD88_002881 [Enterobacter hormaechei]|nr:hypothetical protein [Enterobacter hormaechei]
MYSDKELTTFIPVPEMLQKRSKLSNEANILYAWCWRFFQNLTAKNQVFYLNWYQAAIILHKSPATAKRTIKELTESGLLVKSGRMPDGSCTYHVRDWRCVKSTVLESDEEYQKFLATLDKVKGKDSERYIAYIEANTEEPEEEPAQNAPEAPQEAITSIFEPDYSYTETTPQKPAQSVLRALGGYVGKAGITADEIAEYAEKVEQGIFTLEDVLAGLASRVAASAIPERLPPRAMNAFSFDDMPF